MSETQFEKLERRLGYRFNHPALLRQALSHRSFAKENNERLEFLGDAILNASISQQLYDKFPTASEGQLSRLRANLVKGEMLAQLALELDIGSALLLGQGELKSGGHRRHSILADAVEAIIAAIYLDKNLITAQEKILEWFRPRMDKLSIENVQKDPKSNLQEWLQARQLPLPEYHLVETTGKEHDQEFIVHCHIANLKDPVIGTEKSRRKAEQKAAKQALEVLLR